MASSSTTEYFADRVSSIHDLKDAWARRYDGRYENARMASCHLTIRYHNQRIDWRKVSGVWLVVEGLEWIDSATVKITALAEWPDDPNMDTCDKSTYKICITCDIKSHRGPIAILDKIPS